MRASVSRQAGAVVGLGLLGVAAAIAEMRHAGFLPWLDLGDFLWLCAFVIPLLSFVTALFTRLLLARRLRKLIGVIESATRHDYLTRISDQGEDEVGEVGRAVNRLLDRVTALNRSLEAQGKELAETQNELRLRGELSQKNAELEERLRERALLFDMLRMGTSSIELNEVLHRVVSRLAEVLELREVAMFIREGELFAIRAAHGFPDEQVLLGRTLRGGEGIVGAAGQRREAVVIDDVSVSHDYLRFWGEARADGSLAAVPMFLQDELVGVLSASRPPDRPLTDVQLKLLEAIADQAALAIHNAQLYEQVRELSTHDELTGLANRRLMRAHLDMDLMRARRFAQALSVIALDIDHFKQLNDREGHATGDAALRQVSRLLEATVRGVDLAARVGGEEFVVLLPRASGAEATAVADKIRVAICSAPISGGRGQPGGHLSVSLGVAEWERHDEDGSITLERADAALYAAKRGGRNRVVLAGQAADDA